MVCKRCRKDKDRRHQYRDGGHHIPGDQERPPSSSAHTVSSASASPDVSPDNTIKPIWTTHNNATTVVTGKTQQAAKAYSDLLDGNSGDGSSDGRRNGALSPEVAVVNGTTAVPPGQGTVVGAAGERRKRGAGSVSTR